MIEKSPDVKLYEQADSILDQFVLPFALHRNALIVLALITHLRRTESDTSHILMVRSKNNRQKTANNNALQRSGDGSAFLNGKLLIAAR